LHIQKPTATRRFHLDRAHKFIDTCPNILVVLARDRATRDFLALGIVLSCGLALRLLVVAAESLVDGVLDSTGELVGHAHALLVAAGDVLGGLLVVFVVWEG
jgi:hypothetical protein